MMRNILCAVGCLTVLVALMGSSRAQVLYSQDFDVDDSSNWTTNDSAVTDFFVDYFFDYSSVGIPAAPNSAGGATRGMKLQANLFSQTFGGFSVSPTGQSFTGDYVLSYDMWQSVHGVPFVPAEDIFPAGGGIIQSQANGGTNLGYAGIETSGTFQNSPGTADGIWFAATGDGDSGSDFRVYSSDRDVSYQTPVSAPTGPDFCACDADASYFGINDLRPVIAGGPTGEPTRNASWSSLYVDNFGSEGTLASMAALFPDSYVQDPANISGPGTLGFAWRQHTITKVGNTVTWAVDGVDLISLDTSNFTIPTGGSNILFGHSDINNDSSSNAEAFDLLFTLVDNVEVNVFVEPPAEDADFDGDSDIDGADFLAWQRGFGIDDGTALPGNGDANDDGNVDGLDLGIWESQFGTSTGAIAAVPEPSALLISMMSLVGIVGGCRGRRRV